MHGAIKSRISGDRGRREIVLREADHGADEVWQRPAVWLKAVERLIVERPIMGKWHRNIQVVWPVLRQQTAHVFGKRISVGASQARTGAVVQKPVYGYEIQGFDGQAPPKGSVDRVERTLFWNVEDDTIGGGDWLSSRIKLVRQLEVDQGIALRRKKPWQFRGSKCLLRPSVDADDGRRAILQNDVGSSQRRANAMLLELGRLTSLQQQDWSFSTMSIAEVIGELSGETEAGRAERTAYPYGLRWRSLHSGLGFEIGIPGVFQDRTDRHGFGDAGSVIRYRRAVRTRRGFFRCMAMPSQ